MPKIIANIKEQLLLETKKQINERGYENTTIRSVAQECGVAVGTVYNYFKSKDMLIASFILNDWIVCIDTIARYPKENRRDYLAFIHISLLKFSKNHQSVFTNKEAEKVFKLAFAERHKQIRDQLADLIIPISNNRFTAEYVAEALLCWTMAGKSFDDIYSLLPQVIK